MKPSRVFLDANAGLGVREEVLASYVEALREAPGNPTAINRRGRHAQAMLEDARAEVGALLGVDKRDLVFTAGATEANNLALYGIAGARRSWTGSWPLLVSSEVEHPAALAPLRRMQEDGAKLLLLPVDRHARVDLGPLAEAAANAEHGVLLSMQWANNETGAVQPVADAEALVGEDVDWHCDAVQGIGRLPWGEELRHASSLTLSGHKIGAPKGIGLLMLRESTPYRSLLVGGGQQGNRRSGTESAPLAAAFAHALRLALAEQETRVEEDVARRTCLLQILHDEGFNFQENHPQKGCLTNTLNLSFPGVDGRLLLPALDAEGLDVASGSACSSGAAQASRILLACGLSEELALASLRLSFPPDLSLEEAEEAARRMCQALRRIYKVAKR
jgi:cysteine desulfurase